MSEAHDPDASPEAFEQFKTSLNILKGRKQWWSARQHIEQMTRAAGATNEQRQYLDQQIALCTYKDPELRRSDALHEALEVLLPGGADRTSVTSSETAGIAGAIHKRMWELDGREFHLRDALQWYEHGADLVTRVDADFDAYPVINAAFAAELLAHVRNDSSSPGLRERAAEHRTRLRSHFEEHEIENWWDLASELEARLGSSLLDEAADLIPNIREFTSGTAAWERESTANQMVALVSIIDPPIDPSEIEHLLDTMIPDGHPDAWRGFGHRFGVALSGGGFRASLFHFGVLARLAELDLLRKVQVLSCVSGGSIAGAAYYSALAELIESKSDREITPNDVANKLTECMETFTQAVSGRNLRMQAFLGPVTLARTRMLSRSRRAGWLFIEHLVRPLRSNANFSSLEGLKVFPDGDDGFIPKANNWERGTYVPTLLLNATSLGTGRPWRFTATSLGEPVEPDSAVDPIAHLEPIWLDRNAPPGAELPTVGEAIAASACVPGLFPPLRLTGLYNERVVALVDGGVFDNQGVSGLMEHDCTEVFISDASGLMPEKTKPSRFAAKILLRVNTVLMSAVRSAGASTTDQSELTGQVRNSWFIHMLQGIPAERVPPIGAPYTDNLSPAGAAVVDPAVQRAASALRTDLDRFTTAEAWTLMACGYRLATQALADQQHPMASEPFTHPWPFRAIDPWIDREDLRKRLLRELEPGKKLFFKSLPLGRRPLPRSALEQGG